MHRRSLTAGKAEAEQTMTRGRERRGADDTFKTYTGSRTPDPVRKGKERGSVNRAKGEVVCRRQHIKYFWVCDRVKAVVDEARDREKTHEHRLSLTRDIPKVLVILPENFRKDLFSIGGKRG